MKKYDLYVGCNENGKGKYDRSYVRFVIEQALENAGFDGCTFTDGIGLWKGVGELTVICTVCSDRERMDVLNVAGIVKEHLRQESVMVIESEPRIAFV
jgi:hypothetical protein